MKSTAVKKIRKIILILLSAASLVIGAVLIYLTLTEYRPMDTENIPLLSPDEEIRGEGIDPKVPHTLLSWNIGYCGLSQTADFFMDGGKGVRTVSKSSLKENLAAIVSGIKKADPDIIFLQEIDRNSTRSYHTDETAWISGQFSGMSAAFANNFKVGFVPYPLPPIGKIDSGIMTLTGLPARSAKRIQLPVPFSWPVRTANLKRCLLTRRIPVADHSDGGTFKKELVLINLHLEAYDDGEGKEAQTRMLADLMLKEYDRGNYVIAGGDFNQSFSGTDTSAYPVRSPGLWQCGRLDESAFPDGFRFLMDNSCPTCRSLDRPYDPDDDSFQYYLIDGFIVSGNVKAEEMRTLDYGFVNADHNPVYLKFTLS